MKQKWCLILLGVALVTMVGCQTMLQKAVQKKDWEAAVRAYTRQIEKEENYDLLMGRGIAYAELCRYENAMNDFAKARILKLNDGGRAALQEAKMALKSKQFERASEAADAALEADDRNTEAFFVRGICAVRQKDHAKGKSSLLIVRNKFPSDSDESIQLLQNLAIACFYLKEFAQAEQYYTEYMSAKQSADRYLMEEDYYWAGAIADVNMDDEARDEYWSNLSSKFKKQKRIK